MKVILTEDEVKGAIINWVNSHGELFDVKKHTVKIEQYPRVQAIIDMDEQEETE